MARNENGTREKCLIADLTSKYYQKPWNETFQLVRRSMSNVRVDSESSRHLSACLQRLQEALNVSSLSAMLSRLEIIAKQRGLGSHRSPTETTCYLTADLFYLEVLLKPDGSVEDVKVALHGQTPVSSDLLLLLLRQHKFEDFSSKLNDLSSLYNIHGDNDTKIKAYTALQFMEKDLLTISHMPRSLKENDIFVDAVLNGRVGKIVPSGTGTLMRIQYCISPSDLLLRSHGGDIDGLTQDALVMLKSKDTTHQLQLGSLIPSPPQTDAQGPLTEVASESLPACFILKLQPPLALCASVLQRIEQITNVKPESDQQWEPLLQLLMTTTLGEKDFQESWNHGREATFLVALPGNQVHRYVLSGAAWSGGSWEGALIDSIPFTHPAHVPSLLELLRHQSAVNTLLVSCIRVLKDYPGASCDLYCEVLPESDFSFSITFLHPGSSSLAVLLVTVMDFRQVHCQLFAPELVDCAMNDYISRVMTRCLSIPVTMRAIYKILTNPICTDASGTTADPESSSLLEVSTAVPESSSLLEVSTAVPESSSSLQEVNTTVPATVSHSLHPAPDLIVGPSKMQNSEEPLGPTPQNPTKEEDPAMYTSPSCYVMSVSSTQEESNANTQAAANHYPLSSVCAFPHWPASGHLAEFV